MLFCVVNMKQEILFDNVNIWIIFITDKAHSVNTGYIEYDSHCKWLSGRLSSGCCSIFICMREHGGDCLKTKVELSNCTKNKQKMDREAFEKTENHQKNCVECISANEFSDSLGGGMSLLDRQGWL